VLPHLSFYPSSATAQTTEDPCVEPPTTTTTTTTTTNVLFNKYL
jgi:hypothetical protein